ncbi:hypothetical protein JTB14_010171 [Gonioctena quinquepunctata]|nr:hypothetical protein JTB14_010171 [Gonioctena quinquepunctata]
MYDNELYTARRALCADIVEGRHYSAFVVDVFVAHKLHISFTSYEAEIPSFQKTLSKKQNRMAEDEYIKKMENLQQYIPFLNNMIAQLKDPNKKNREQQLSKMESLHAMITDKKKKLKLETLNKCEDVISKLYFKVNHKPLNLLQRDPLHSPGLTQSPRSTPASPSPSRDMKDVFDIRPLPIPVERLEPESRIPKVDIYSSAAESLNKPRPSNDIHPKVPDMSKPPISLEDLKGLEEDVHEKINAGASLNELNSMRNKIAHQIILEQMKSMSPSSKQKEEIDTPDRNNSSSPQPTDKGKKEETPKDSPKRFSTDIDKKSPRTDSPRRAIQINLKPKPSPKVLSEPASIFGNVLVTIDDKIIEDTKKDRRSSLTKEEKVKAEEKSSTDESKKKEEKSKEKTKERRISTSSRDEKKSEGKGSDKTKEKEGESLENNSEHKEKSSKQKSDSKESRKDEKSRSTEQDKRKDDRKKIDKRRESSSIDRKSKNEHRTLDKLKETKGKDQIANEDIFQIEDGTKDQKNSAGSIKSQIVVKKIEDLREPKVNAIASLISKQIEELKGMNRETADANKDTPVYKRLADKYNPKPRKLAVDSDVDKAVADSIEANMKISPPKIPILNRLSDVPPPPASLVKCSQLEPEMPNVLQKIMNPSTTQLINTMVNQLRQTNVESDRMMTPIPSTSSLIQPVPHPGHKTPLLLNPPLLPNPPLLSKAPLLPNPSLVHNPSLLMSPTDSFVSEYARDDNFVSDYSRDDYGCTNPAAMRSELRFDQSSTISMNNRFIPPSINQPRFNQAYNNFNHNQVENIHQLDYYPPNAPLPSNQFNGGPPLLSPETPHFQEHKNISFGMTDRNFLQKEDLRWRLDDNRVQWDRRDFDTRYRGPTTYREYREMRENSRDPRVARDPRENRDPRDSRDPRDNSRDSRDPRDNSRDSRDPRDNSRDNRDPRDTRDPRINRDSSRDPRDSRDSRDPRDVRDPRLNRDFERGRSRGREDYRSGRYESKFDRIYARTNRERSRSRSATNDKESFVSPLDSLYSGKEEHKTGKGYGKQSFRIPKIKKEADPVKTEPTHDVLIVPDDSGNENKDDAPENCENRDQESDDGVDNDNVHNVDTDDSDGAPEEAESKGSIESKEVERVQEKECKPKPVFSEVNTSADTEEIKISNIKDPELSSSSDGTKDVKVLDQMDKDSTALREADLQNEGETQHEVKSQEQKQELKPPAEQTILAQFFANLLDDDEDSSEDEEVHRKKTANVEQEKSKIEPDVEMASEASQKKIDFLEEETVLHKEDTVLEEKTLPEGDTLPEEDALPEEDSTPEKEIVPKRRLRKRIRRVSSESPKGERKKESNEEDESGKTTPSDIDKSTEGDVVVTVGERIKSRKRISVNSVKPRKKCRSELDKLHEDIQDMFIRDGVLTATGKRMCHLLKDDPHALSPSAPSTSETEEPPRVRKKPGPKPKIRHSEATEVNAMKHVRVIISKIPESEMQDSEKYSRRLTRSMTFLESDDETSVHETESTKELSDGENDSESESSDTEKGLSQANESNQNIKTKRKLKRKRGSGWASGIIKKVKKKKTLLEEPVPQADEETAEDSIENDFLEPDKDYYVDFAMQNHMPVSFAISKENSLHTL